MIGIVIFCLPCLSLLFVFAIVGIFFPKYRPLIKEAWECFWKKLTLRPCEQSFDQKMRGKILAWCVKNNHPKMGKFINKHYNTILSIIGVIFIIINIILLYLFIKWIILGLNPCKNKNGICTGV